MTKPHFSWPSAPLDEQSFEEMMLALDQHLGTVRNLGIDARPLSVPVALHQALGWEGNVFPPASLATEAGFEGQVLLAKAYAWYEATYGDRLKIHFGPGSVVLWMRGATWRLRLPGLWGSARLFADRDLSNEGVKLAKNSNSPPASANAVHLIEGVTQTLASKLTDVELRYILEATVQGHVALTKLKQAKGDELFEAARDDYSSSVEALMDHAWPNARWHSAHCFEKFLKARLRGIGVTFPTSGRLGHDIQYLGGLMATSTHRPAPQALLRSLDCPTPVRYRDIPSTRAQAFDAHASLLQLLMWA